MFDDIFSKIKASVVTWSHDQIHTIGHGSRLVTVSDHHIIKSESLSDHNIMYRKINQMQVKDFIKDM